MISLTKQIEQVRLMFSSLGTKTKINSLIVFQEQAQKIMLHQEALETFFSRHKILSIFARRGNLWIKLAFYNSLTINTLIILSYT